MTKVSVCMITYNHEPFIAEAIDSVLMQRANFAYELVIGEDCSTDGTRAVVQRYAEQHPEVIRPLFREQNLGMHRNFVDTLAHCRGKYVALLEGDDYWTDPYKLQKQAEFLDENPEYVLVCGNALTIREDEGYRSFRVALNLPEALDFDTRYLLVNRHCITLTLMFRNGLVTDFPPEFYRSVVGDHWFVVLLSLHGKGRYFNDVYGVYRIHSRGAYHSRHQTLEGTVAYLKERIHDAQMWDRYFRGEYAQELQTFCFTRAKTVVRYALMRGQLREAMAYARFIHRDKLRAKRSRLFIGALQALADIFGIEPSS